MSRSTAKTPKVTIDPDHKLRTRELILKIIPDGETWLKTPNSRFGGQTPEELIGTPYEQALRNLVFLVKDGGLS
jgi:hypothetical protein